VHHQKHCSHFTVPNLHATTVLGREPSHHHIFVEPSSNKNHHYLLPYTAL
jgi:hypothetical protein